MSYLSFALDARVSFAHYRVAIIAGDQRAATARLNRALRFANQSGTACAAEDETAPCPALVADVEQLSTEFRRTFEAARARKRALRTREGIAAELDLMATTAASGCGQVYELFADRFSGRVDHFLCELESPYHSIALELATHHGYCTPEERAEEQHEREESGSCSLTGIDPWCCPCGRHE